jgi:transposase
MEARREKPRGSRKKSELEIELDQARKEIVVLRKERDILKKAAAFFAKESL